MKKYIIILFSMLLFASSTIGAQINPIKRGSSSSKKTERTQKKSETKTGKERKKTVQKHKRSRTDSEDIIKELTELRLTDPAEAWEFKSSGMNLLIHFASNRVSIAPDQLANVERVASYLKSHPEAKCTIKGYSSPEGRLERAILLAGNRAASVRDMLISKYGIDPNRIQAINGGISNMYDELRSNRVAICEIHTRE